MLNLDDPDCYEYRCPYCHCSLLTGDWYIPGMRKLVELRCPDCEREFYGDLPAGYAQFYPMLLDRETGEVYNGSDRTWFADRLEQAYSERNDNSFELEIEQRETPTRAVLLNCLDVNYGHSLQKLLHADYYLTETDLDVVVLVPPFLRWMVPDEVAAIWTMDVSLSSGGAWSDRVADQIRTRVSQMEKCYLDVGTDHVQPADYEIERFTGIEPFKLVHWNETPPTVTFIWRDAVEYSSATRLWCSVPETEPDLVRPFLWQPVRQCRGLLNIVADRLGYSWPSITEQVNNISQTAAHLRRQYNEIEIAVAGIGDSGSFPDWIDDQRVTTPTAEQERQLCRQYAESQVVVGIHGSQMVLPSAHAGAVIELLPPEKWDHYGDDIAFRSSNTVESFLRHRMLPAEIPIPRLATVIQSTLDEFDFLRSRNKPKHNLKPAEREELRTTGNSK